MTALHPEGLKAAQAAYRDHALAKDFSPGAVEKVVAAYVAIAYPAPKTSLEESSRFTGDDGVPMVSVTVAQSFPFARALAHEWGLADGRDHTWKLKHKALVLPASTYDAILPKVRHRLRASPPRAGGLGGLDE